MGDENDFCKYHPSHYFNGLLLYCLACRVDAVHKKRQGSDHYNLRDDNYFCWRAVCLRVRYGQHK